jgi:chitin disaccharide deacetylase
MLPPVEQIAQDTFFDDFAIRNGALASRTGPLGRLLELLKKRTANSAYFRRAAGWFVSRPRRGTKITERLGFRPDARLLIVNADDFGLCVEQNLAIMEGFQSGILSCASLMAPCPGFEQACEYARRYPKTDLGLHLTLTSEWDAVRWGPILDPKDVPSLVDADNCFWRTRADLFASCKAEEAEAELRAQIERALVLGLDITHLDSHMFALHSKRTELQKVYLKLAHDYLLPIRAASRTLMHWQNFDSVPEDADRLGILHPDHFAVLSRVDPSRVSDFWRVLLSSLPPGLTEICCHPAYACGELARFAEDAAQRESDLRVIMSAAVRQLIEREEIQLVGYRLLRDAMRQVH